jgi:protein-S-isoprenylcysteine O-methyltransferase Ste14
MDFKPLFVLSIVALIAATPAAAQTDANAKVRALLAAQRLEGASADAYDAYRRRVPMLLPFEPRI